MLTVDDGHTDVESAQQEALTLLAGVGADTEGTILRGNPGRVIPREIDRSMPDMVVMGVRGLRGVKRLLVGSTTATVAKRSDTTLLVAHAIESG